MYRNQLLLALFAIAFGGWIGVEAYTPVFDNTHILTNGEVTIEVMDPTASDRQDRGVRFSPMAFVIQANRGDTNYFYAPVSQTAPPWNDDPDRYPAGTPMEFDLGDFDIRPPGFDETSVGGRLDEFIKIGVGLLRNTVGGDYHQNNEYEFLGAETNVQWGTDSAVFTQSLLRESDTGYSYALTTTVRLDGVKMFIDYELTNDGSQAFQTAQYLHNFTLIDGEPPRSSTEIRVPWEFTATGLKSGVVSQVDQSLVYHDNLETNPSGAKPVIPVDNIGDAPYEMLVLQNNIDQKYQAAVQLPEPTQGAAASPLGIASWNDSSGVQFSPEQFVEISLDPGQTIAWSRSYAFGVVPEPSTIVMLAGASLIGVCCRKCSMKSSI